MDEIITDDGSITYRNLVVDELYHTKAGAIVEALEKHARALLVWEKDAPIIFDVCSGLAYSAACALEEIRAHNNNSLVTIYLFENDRHILEKCLELPDSLEYVQNNVKKHITCYTHFKMAIKRYLQNNINIYENNNLRIIIMFGDAMKMLDNVHESADYIFYAPFSPKITPDMWTNIVFRKLYAHMHSGGKLSTYSYARSVRDSLTQAGFKVENGPTIGRRSPSLIGFKE